MQYGVDHVPIRGPRGLRNQCGPGLGIQIRIGLWKFGHLLRFRIRFSKLVRISECFIVFQIISLSLLLTMNDDKSNIVSVN